MSVILHLAFAFVVLVVALAIFRLVRRDYARHGKLTLWSAALQPVVFALHAALLNLGLTSTYWPRLPNSRIQVVAGLGIAHRMALVEEEHLRRLHGEVYQRYCEHGARYIGLPQVR